MRHYRAVCFLRSVLQCSIRCPVGCSREVVLLRIDSTCPLLRCPLVGIDGIRHINAPVARLHFRSVHRRVLTVCGSSVSPMHANSPAQSVGRYCNDGIRVVSIFLNTRDIFRSVRRRILTACGSSVSSLM